MVEHSAEKKFKELNKSEDVGFKELLYSLLLQKSDLLYFICRRGSWSHAKQRGKKIDHFDPRGILKDREIYSVKLAKNLLNQVSKNNYLIKVIPRKDWKKSMHSMPAMHCALDSYGKKFFKYLLRNNMVEFIEDNYSIENYKDFFNAFNDNFKLPLTEDDIRRYEVKNLKQRLNRKNSAPRQERTNNPPSNNSFYEENHTSHQANKNNISGIVNSSIPICSKKSKLIHDMIIEAMNISDEHALNLLLNEDQTILDITYNNKITSNWLNIAVLAKLNELTSRNLIEVGLKNGINSWRLKNSKGTL